MARGIRAGPMELGLRLSEGWGRGVIGSAAVLGVSQNWALASKSFSFLQNGSGHGSTLHKRSSQGFPCAPLAPVLTASTGTTPTEEPTATAWGLEGPLLGLGQSSPVLEDWEGESAWVQVLALLWTVAWALAGRGHMRRGHSLGEEPSTVLVFGHDGPWK